MYSSIPGQSASGFTIMYVQKKVEKCSKMMSKKSFEKSRI